MFLTAEMEDVEKHEVNIIDDYNFNVSFDQNEICKRYAEDHGLYDENDEYDLNAFEELDWEEKKDYVFDQACARIEDRLSVFELEDTLNGFLGLQDKLNVNFNVGVGDNPTLQNSGDSYKIDVSIRCELDVTVWNKDHYIEDDYKNLLGEQISNYVEGSLSGNEFYGERDQAPSVTVKVVENVESKIIKDFKKMNFEKSFDKVFANSMYKASDLIKNAFNQAIEGKDEKFNNNLVNFCLENQVMVDEKILKGMLKKLDGNMELTDAFDLYTFTPDNERRKRNFEHLLGQKIEGMVNYVLGDQKKINPRYWPDDYKELRDHAHKLFEDKVDTLTKSKERGKGR